MLKDRLIVYTAGTFDMFHTNHLKMIEYARGLGDVLIVGVSTDELVTTYKQPPVIPFEERIEIIKALKMVDIVIPQYTLDHSELIKKLNIDAFVVGDDWIGKYDYLNEIGVKVFYFPYGRGISSTDLRDRIIENFNSLKKTVDEHINPDIKRVL